MNAELQGSVEPRLVDTRTLARLLGCSVRHLQRMTDSGKMPVPVHLGAAVRWDLQAIERWIDQGCPETWGARGCASEQQGGPRR